MSLLDLVILILLLSWAGGFAIHVGGGLIHLLLVVAVVVLLVRVIRGGKV